MLSVQEVAFDYGMTSGCTVHTLVNRKGTVAVVAPGTVIVAAACAALLVTLGTAQVTLAVTGVRVAPVTASGRRL